MTPADTLYQYLLSHEQAYGMQVFSMKDDENQRNNEYALVRLHSAPLINNETAENTNYKNDFDVTLIVTWLDQYRQQTIDSHEITLKYYIMLTSKRNCYPKREVESNNKIGKFRTVYSVDKSVYGSQHDSLNLTSNITDKCKNEQILVMSDRSTIEDEKSVIIIYHLHCYNKFF